MELAYLTAGLAVAFFCVFFYRQGVKDGRREAEKMPFEPIISKPKSKDEKEQDKADKEVDNNISAQFQELVNYQPKFAAKRGDSE